MIAERKSICYYDIRKQWVVCRNGKQYEWKNQSYCDVAFGSISILLFKSEENQVIDILELSFVDADEPDSLDVNDIIAAEKDLLCDKDAERIVEFSEKYKNKLLIIHCDAGISRSSGIAAAILRHYTGDDAEIFDNYSYDPNMWCYFKTLKAFGDELF